MKKIAFFILGLVTLCFISCKDKKENKVIIPDDPRMDQSMKRTSEDTLAVLDMANKFLTALKENDLKGALDQLIEVDSNAVKPMSEARKRELAQGLGVFPVESYTIDEVIDKYYYDTYIPINMIGATNQRCFARIPHQ